MADRKYYVVCDMGCKFESMTKEQILTAITQAVNEGTISDIDTGFVQTIKTINGKGLKFFVGTQSEYEGLTAEEKENLFAIITNDTTKDALFNALEEMQKEVESLIGAITPTPALLESKTLPCAGYYSISALWGTTMFCFGLIYWDGIHDTHATKANALMGLQIISDGRLYLANSAGAYFEKSDEVDFYVAMIGG